MHIRKHNGDCDWAMLRREKMLKWKELKMAYENYFNYIDEMDRQIYPKK